MNELEHLTTIRRLERLSKEDLVALCTRLACHLFLAHRGGATVVPIHVLHGMLARRAKSESVAS